MMGHDPKKTSSQTGGSRKPLSLTLKVWRQATPEQKGAFASYPLSGVSPDMSFLEMLDMLNQGLIKEGKDPVAFEHDCREGICGSCGVVIDGNAHGPQKLTTTCQLHMRHFKSGDTITVEPFRAKAFPIIKDLVVDRSAFDRILRKGGYISTNVGSAPEANATPVPKEASDRAMDSAQCIGCGACVASCPNSSASLFVAAKISHLGMLPQGQSERSERALGLVLQMEKEGFGSCSNAGVCEATCPKGISLETIARMNNDFRKASLSQRPAREESDG